MVMTRKAWRLLAAEAQWLKQRGRQVEAIKCLRRQTNCGLKEAYDAVNKLGTLPPIMVPRP